ncbi:MAG: hypothetical protein R3F60_15675 [bacterium]
MAVGSVAAAGLGFTPACKPVEQADAGLGCPAAPTCQQNTLIECTDGGVLTTPCGADRCAADGPTARCVPASALPCDPGTPPVRCENGRLVACDEASGYLLAQACPAGQFCAGEETPRCVDARDIRCNPDLWSPLCVAGERFECQRDQTLVAVPADCD